MKEIIKTGNAPAAIGPYSQAVKISCGEMLFVSGQIALDPASMEMVGTTAAEQCEQAMKNLTEVLKAAGCELSQVVKTTVYLADMNDFAAVNEVYAKCFGDARPARAAIEVSRLPKDAIVEIDAIVVIQS